MWTKLSSWSISSTRLPLPVASGAKADSGFGGSPRKAWNSAAALTWHSRSSAGEAEPSLVVPDSIGAHIDLELVHMRVKELTDQKDDAHPIDDARHDARDRTGHDPPHVGPHEHLGRRRHQKFAVAEIHQRAIWR